MIAPSDHTQINYCNTIGSAWKIDLNDSVIIISEKSPRKVQCVCSITPLKSPNLGKGKLNLSGSELLQVTNAQYALKTGRKKPIIFNSLKWSLGEASIKKRDLLGIFFRIYIWNNGFDFWLLTLNLLIENLFLVA